MQFAGNGNDLRNGGYKKQRVLTRADGLGFARHALGLQRSEFGRQHESSAAIQPRAHGDLKRHADEHGGGQDAGDEERGGV